MTVRVPVRPEMVTWARERSGLASDALFTRFGHLEDWERGEKQPTLRQLEDFAKATYTPIGYLFLAEPPDEPLPLPDFRTMGDVQLAGASPNLLDTIYQCQERQEWYRDYSRVRREDPLAFVGSLTPGSDVVAAADGMREFLDFAPGHRGSTWSAALRTLADQADSSGVLVMVSGIVGSNTHRKLNPHEFRGFALADERAPVVFVNGSDTKAAQIFTLAHELVHIWIGQSAVSDADMLERGSNDTERWCNQVAAEFLLPSADLLDYRLNPDDITAELNKLATRFKVSTLVALRRLYDAGHFNLAEYRHEYTTEQRRELL
jgi:Zn-dependent peptidase ImmA (M78 family)/transcriptional regulator with XRE-family HTH domain